MAKNTDYIAKLSVLAHMAEEQMRQPSLHREAEAQALLDSMITALSREWITPLDREDIALVGQCLVRLIKTIGDMTNRERAIAVTAGGSLAILVGYLSDLHKTERCLSAALAFHRQIKETAHVDRASSPAFHEYIDTMGECVDMLIGIILKYS